MKRILFALLLIPVFVQSQTESVDKSALKDTWTHYKWEIGINGGINITGVNGVSDTAGTVEENIGRLYGLTIAYHFNRWLALKTDFDFEDKGWTVNGYDLESASGEQNITQNLDYFDIPMFLHAGFGNRLKFDLNFGPYFAFLTNNEAFYTDSTGAKVPVTAPAFTDFNTFDFGLTYGGGLDFALGKRVSLGFDLLYQHGLTEIHKNGFKNTSLDFDFGINFMFGEK